ncbi:hypothetical protein BT96DRAFT_852950 [Gymnopus androsaceus JB14]|uniref:Glycosyl transferase CAP10 domain-containing protein n=1 Tax=Gymnopus androsaceus JB14 TaxID=1447944 RepID=A0A6A4I7F5_9AGAR|nr:hypothetical protein BT96DRAFT_852950 [Gymnopus androsaceus JB14]
MSTFKMSSRIRRSLRLLLMGIVLSLISALLTSHFFHDVALTYTETTLQFSLENNLEEYPRTATGEHTFRPDGLVEVDLLGPHPIFELIDRAEKTWKEKKRKASSSLDEAIAEYRRRYRRSPPKGFDKWWDYIQENDVQLPDEYDQIYNDLEPFWGMEPRELIALQAAQELIPDSYTLGKDAEGKLEVLRTTFREDAHPGVKKHPPMILEYLKNIEDVLPSFRATFTPHDGPDLLTDHMLKSVLLEAASTDSYIDKNSLPSVHHLGWRSACPPESPARLIDLNLDGPPSQNPKKTFIHDHRQSMDPCLHPSLFGLHGQFLSNPNGPNPSSIMIPKFTSCTTAVHHNIRIPTPYLWVEDIFPRSDDPDFDDKEDERLLWRGSNTGIYYDSSFDWQSSHRDRLVRLVNELNGTLDYLIPPESGYEDQPLSPLQTARKARINPAIMDIAFAGEPTHCSESACTLMKNLYEYKKPQSYKDAGNYKYVFDVDGNGWSGRFKRLITSNSLIFKSTIYPEWFTDRIAPWVHYIPVQVDLSDLYDSLIFFRGDANGEGAHEDLARKIALQGREWSKTFWRKEDILAYFYRLFLEYARLMSLDRESMTFQGEGELDLDGGDVL